MRFSAASHLPDDIPAKTGTWVKTVAGRGREGTGEKKRKRGVQCRNYSILQNGILPRENSSPSISSTTSLNFNSTFRPSLPLILPATTVQTFLRPVKKHRNVQGSSDFEGWVRWLNVCGAIQPRAEENRCCAPLCRGNDDICLTRDTRSRLFFFPPVVSSLASLQRLH